MMKDTNVEDIELNIKSIFSTNLEKTQKEKESKKKVFKFSKSKNGK